jgi:alkanesulfonate monooxygenase SsuD/methylene tetrahydromethanopterin reductase-like flavin-dependent oxidoreductase (luciferase family)
MLEAYTLLGALAARTRRVQLGTLVTGVTYRNPAILAKIITTLDVISKIMIGGGGEKRTLRLVARYADMCNVTGDAATLARKISVLRRHCAEAGRDPAEVSVTWMTPLILTTSSQNTAETREMLAAAVGAEETAGFTVGQPHEIPGLVAGHIEAGADEVIFSCPFADAAAITAVGEALGLSRQ